MRSTIPFFMAAFLVPQVVSAVDLTPAHGFRDLEGFRIPVVRFADGARRITYQPPAKWRVSGGGESLHLFPPACDEASMQLCSKGRRTTEENSDAWTRDLLPPTSAGVERIGESAGLFTLGAQPSRAVTYTYSLSGRRFQASIATVDLSEKEQLVVIVTARQHDFKVVHDEAIASLFSWQWDDE